MSKVRRVLGLALEGKAPVGNPVPLYLACADYLQHSLGRLHAQDHRLWERLDPHAGPGDAAFRDKLTRLKSRLAASEKAHAGLMQARDSLRAGGAAHRGAFENEARAFLDVFLNVLSASRHATLSEEEKRFADGDWDYVADNTAEAAERELHLFDRVENAAPGAMNSLPPVPPPPAREQPASAKPEASARQRAGERR